MFLIRIKKKMPVEPHKKMIDAGKKETNPATAIPVMKEIARMIIFQVNRINITNAKNP